MRALSAADVRALVSADDALRSQREAFIALARGEAQLAPRAVLGGPDGSAAFSYLARAGVGLPPVVKLGSVNPANAARGLPGIHALVLVMDPDTGELAWSIDGESLTLMRTAAATTVAVQALCPRAGVVAIIGSGPQAVEHAALMRHTLPECEVRVHARRPERAVAVREELAGRAIEATVVGDASAAASGAEVVITATNAAEPVLRAEWLDSARLVVSIGSFAPDRCEVGADVVAMCHRVVVDDRATAAAQCGPVAEAIRSGALDESGLLSLGEVLATDVERPEGQRWAFFSVGLGVQDAAMAAAIVPTAEALGRGREVALSSSGSRPQAT